MCAVPKGFKIGYRFWLICVWFLHSGFELSMFSLEEATFRSLTIRPSNITEKNVNRIYSGHALYKHKA